MKRNDSHTAAMAMPTSRRRNHKPEAGSNTRPVEVEIRVLLRSGCHLRVASRPWRNLVLFSCVCDWLVGGRSAL